MNKAVYERQGGPYRSRRGMVFGVCQGLADHLDVSVFWLRLAAVVVTPISGLWPMMGAYIVAAFLMKPEPVLPLETAEDAEFYSAYTASSSMAVHRLKRTFDNLDRRIQRMEDIVTARDYDWDRRFDAASREGE